MISIWILSQQKSEPMQIKQLKGHSKIFCQSILACIYIDHPKHQTTQTTPTTTTKLPRQMDHKKVVTKNDNKYKDKEDFNLADLEIAVIIPSGFYCN